MSISNGKTSSDIENAEWNSTGMLTHTRYGSSSSHASQSSGDICRICHCESDPQNPLLTPCYCSGSLKYVHQSCLQQWLTASETNACELCKFPFIMHTKIKPFNEWRSLEMSGVERRRLFCAVLFHCAAALCVIWSLCVLIERAAEEVRRGLIGWPFWTKLVVVTVGLTGGVVFMYIQCKQYLNLCNRWRARNRYRILLIQNAPEKIHPPQSPVMQQFRRVRTAATSGGGVCGGQGGSGGAGSSVSNNSVTIGPMMRSYDQQLIGSIGVGGGVGGGHPCELQLNQQGQIIAANIENSSISYDRDWTLDDISQVSFKPCIQGSGSLTPMPFHDSAHNICDGGSGSGSGVVVATHRYSAISGSSHTVHEEEQMQQHQAASISEQNNGSSCSSSIKTADLNLFKVPNAELSSVSSSSTAGVPCRYPNSAIFVENRDILNDPAPPCHESVACQAKLYNRRSTVMGGGHYVQEDPRHDLRRYSDTKLLQQQKLSFVSEQPVEYSSPTKDQLLLNPKSIIYDMTSFLGPVVPQEQSPTSSHHHRPHHHHHHHVLVTGAADHLQTTDIQFDSSARGDDHDPETPRPSPPYDPLELNIQEMLELDIANIQRLHETQDPSSPCIHHHRPTPLVVRPVCSSASNPRLQQASAPPPVLIQMPPEPARRQQHLDPSDATNSSQINSNRLKLFKSLPNLSASSENLLPPPKRFDS